MTDTLTIGEVSRCTGVPIKTIRFYEAEQVIPPPARTEAGYRVFTPADVRRLHLARQARLLGLSLPEVKQLVQQAFTAECIGFAEHLLEQLGNQRRAITQRITELEALRSRLEALEEHVRHCQIEAQPGQLVSECEFCPLIDEEGGDAP